MNTTTELVLTRALAKEFAQNVLDAMHSAEDTVHIRQICEQPDGSGPWGLILTIQTERNPTQAENAEYARQFDGSGAESPETLLARERALTARQQAKIKRLQDALRHQAELWDIVASLLDHVDDDLCRVRFTELHSPQKKALEAADAADENGRNASVPGGHQSLEAD